MTDTFTNLADRVEAASGPDRHIDAAICDWLRENAGFTPNRAHIAYPYYAFTESLDAAMTLVPEGFVWGVGSWGNPDTDGPWAWCDTKQNSSDNDLNYGKAATPALALCAAALRAREAEAALRARIHTDKEE